MSSDAKLDPPAGAELECLQFGPVTAAMMSGDDREVRDEMMEEASTGADEGTPLDAMIDSPEEMYYGAKRDRKLESELEDLHPATAETGTAGAGDTETTTKFAMVSLIMTIAMAVRDVRTCDGGRPERTKVVDEFT